MAIWRYCDKKELPHGAFASFYSNGFPDIKGSRIRAKMYGEVLIWDRI